MRKPIATIALLVAWLCANGALLDAVQVFAWSRMFAGYTQTMSLSDALRTTFDPTKPCELCVSVADVKENLNQNSTPTTLENATGKRFILALDTSAPLVIGQPAEAWPDVVTCLGHTRGEPVPLPPPRV